MLCFFDKKSSNYKFSMLERTMPRMEGGVEDEKRHSAAEIDELRNAQQSDGQVAERMTNV